MPYSRNLVNAWYNKFTINDPSMLNVIKYINKFPPKFSNKNLLQKHITVVQRKKHTYKNDPEMSKFLNNLERNLTNRIQVSEARKKEGPITANELAQFVNNMAEMSSREKEIKSNINAWNSWKMGLYKPLRNYMTTGGLPKNSTYAKKVTNAQKYIKKYFYKPYGQGARGLPASVNKLYRGVNNKFPVPANGVVNNKSYSSWTSNKSVANAFTKSNRGLILVMNKNKLGNIPYKWWQNFGRSDPESEFILPPIKFTIGAPYVRNGRRFANVTTKVVRTNNPPATKRSPSVSSSNNNTSQNIGFLFNSNSNSNSSPKRRAPKRKAPSPKRAAPSPKRVVTVTRSGRQSVRR